MEEDLKIGYRNAWLLWLALMAFTLIFFLWVLKFSYRAPRPGWDMGAKPFVPAQSQYGEGWYVPPLEVEGGEK